LTQAFRVAAGRTRRETARTETIKSLAKAVITVTDDTYATSAGFLTGLMREPGGVPE
jgi:hypothetical protein